MHQGRGYFPQTTVLVLDPVRFRIVEDLNSSIDENPSLWGRTKVEMVRTMEAFMSRLHQLAHLSSMPGQNPIRLAIIHGAYADCNVLASQLDMVRKFYCGQIILILAREEDRKRFQGCLNCLAVGKLGWFSAVRQACLPHLITGINAA